jgi:general stress protein YciG
LFNVLLTIEASQHNAKLSSINFKRWIDSELSGSLLMVAKNQHAVALGRLGGKRRAEVLTEEERKEIARNAGLARVAGASEDELAAPGKKGGKARALALTKEQRQEIARKAAAARWGKRK